MLLSSLAIPVVRSYAKRHTDNVHITLNTMTVIMVKINDMN